jgi:hypothetical protein
MTLRATPHAANVLDGNNRQKGIGLNPRQQYRLGTIVKDVTNEH